jgi:cytochrome c oxidase subunit 4
MSSNKAHHAHGSIKTYLWVFFALIVGTILTVAAWKVHIPSILLTILVALAIASVKASLVAGWFMHLASERKMIYAILAFTAFFFLGMMLLTVWATHDAPKLNLP